MQFDVTLVDSDEVVRVRAMDTWLAMKKVARKRGIRKEENWPRMTVRTVMARHKRHR